MTITEAHERAVDMSSRFTTDRTIAAYLAAMEAEGHGNATVAEINAAIAARPRVTP